MDDYASIRTDPENIEPYSTLTVVEDIFAGSVPRNKLAREEAITSMEQGDGHITIAPDDRFASGASI